MKQKRRVLSPNALRIFDLDGNTWEWTHELNQTVGRVPMIDKPMSRILTGGGRYGQMPRQDERIVDNGSNPIYIGALEAIGMRLILINFDKAR